MRVRLRPKWSDEELKKIYAVPHDHTKWKDHLQRVDATIAAANWFQNEIVFRIADLSCGNGYIAKQVAINLDAAVLTLGDYAPGYDLCGPIEQTIHEIGNQNLFILSETLEHLDDPDTVLAEIREKSERLVLSTPRGERSSSNPEHYWGWDETAIEDMLVSAGWRPQTLTVLSFHNPMFIYDYQIWTAR